MNRCLFALVVLSVLVVGCGTNPPGPSSEQQQLFSSIRGHDLEAVERLVESGNVDLDPPTRPYQVNKALAYASIYGNLEIVKYILSQGVDIDGRVAYAGTALLRASEVQKNDIAEFLIRAGADVNAANSFGISPMIGYAIICNPRLIDLALEHGGEIDKAHKMTTSNGYGELAYNPIQWAVNKGNLDCVKHLVDRGAALDVISRDNETLLEMARKQGDAEVISFIASHSLYGRYIHDKDEHSYLELNVDHTFSLVERGNGFSGTYLIDDESITLILPSGQTSKGTISGNTLIDADGQKWILRPREAVNGVQ